MLVLSDEPSRAAELARAIASNGFFPDVIRPQDWLVNGLLNYQAVFMDSLANPSEALWAGMEDYVGKGGGVAVIPGGQEMIVDAYNLGPAQKLLPGTFKKLVTQDKKPAPWNLNQASIFQNKLMKPFQEWTSKDRTPPIDFIVNQRDATKYWEVQPDRGLVLVHYDDDRDRPALLERRSEQADRGKVLMFTTTLDPRTPPWNNYLEAITSFYPVIVGLSTDYLAGESDLAQLNFVCGQGDPPTVRLPPTPRFPAYRLQGPDTFEPFPVPEGKNDVVIKQAVYPGNYSLSSMAPFEGKFVARFSLNLPAEESNLSRIQIGDLEIVLGKGSVVEKQEAISLHDIMQGQWSEPIEMFPSLMVLILLVLALENLLGNRFYKRENP